jgi:hypothetical protein
LPNDLSGENMHFKIGLLALACVAMTATSFVQAQDYRGLGTRRGAVAGAVIGGLIGGKNDEVAAGIIAGGLIGGATGRIVGNRMDQNRYGQNYGYPNQGYSYHQPQSTVHSQQHYYPQYQAQQHYSYPQTTHQSLSQPHYVQQPAYGEFGHSTHGHANQRRVTQTYSAPRSQSYVIPQQQWTQQPTQQQYVVPTQPHSVLELHRPQIIYPRGR